MTTEEVMRLLKNKYNAWLVVKIPTHEDNGVTLDNYLIFIDNDKVLTVYFYDGYQNEVEFSEILSSIREEKSLHYWHNRLLDITKDMDIERKEKLNKILEKLD